MTKLKFPTTSNYKLNKYVVLVIFLAACIYGVISFIKFDDQEIKNFGFTPKYIDVAITTKNTGSYSSHLTFDYSFKEEVDTSKDYIVDEVQREPLYPFSLMIIDYLGYDMVDLVFIQMVIMVVTIWLWGLFIYKFFGRAVTVTFFFALYLSSIIPFYTTILYPYAFQFFLFSTTFWLLTIGYKKDKWIYFLLASIVCGVGIYERGAYLLLPVFLYGVLVIFNYLKYVQVNLKYLLIFPLLTYIIVSPWILRSIKYGGMTMNQMSGYTLGYTYGKLESNTSTDYEREYERHIDEFGVDGGTIGFIEYQIAKNGLTYTEADKVVADIAVEKMVNNKKSVIYRVLLNWLNYPSRLGSGYLQVEKSQMHLRETYDSYVSLDNSTVIDWGVFLLSLFGIIVFVWKKEMIGILSGIFVLYNIAFSTIIVIFGPRYRGMTDIIFYLFFSLSITVIYNNSTFIQNIVKNALNRYRGVIRRLKG